MCARVWLCRWQRPFINPIKRFLPNLGEAGAAIAMALDVLAMIVIASSCTYMLLKYPKASDEFTFNLRNEQEDVLWLMKSQ